MNLASYKAGNNFKTFVFVAALTACWSASATSSAAPPALVVFAAIAVVFNFVMYWFSGTLALKMSRAVEVSAAGARAAPDDRAARRAGRRAQAGRLRDPG